MTDPTTPALDLDALRKIAEAATPGDWTKREPDAGFLFYIQSGDKYLAESSWHKNSPIFPTQPEADANFTHIAAFDPPTVLRLIAAAKERDELRALLVRAGEVLELAENLMLAITGNEPDDLIADGGITVWHGIVVGAQNWLNIQWPKVEDLAARRGVHPNALARRIVVEVVDGDLVDAVLDDADGLP